MTDRDRFLGMLLVAIGLLFALATVVIAISSQHRLGAFAFMGMLTLPLFFIDWRE